MKQDNMKTAMQELNRLLGKLTSDEYPTPETDATIKSVRKVLKIMNPAPAVPAKPQPKPQPKAVVKKAPAKKAPAKKVVKKATKKK